MPSARTPIPVAYVANVLTPYRLHKLRHLARELPEISLHCMFTHDQPDQPWQIDDDPALRIERFGPGQSPIGAYKPRHFFREWTKAGRIIASMRAHGVKAAVLWGYNNACMLRLFLHARREGLPVFLSGDSNVHGDSATGLKRTIKRAYLGALINSSAAVLPMGVNGRALFERYGCPREKLFDFPQIPDRALIESLSPSDVRAITGPLGFAPDRRRVVFCGRLIPLKRCELLIDAFAAIAADRPEWDLVIVGDGPLKSALRGRVPAALAPRIIWTGFIADQRTLGAIYRAGDVLALTSDYDAWGMVVIEAAIAGCAVLCSDVVGVAPELCIDGVTGRTFRSLDGAGLTAALHDLTSPDKIDAYKAASLAHVRQWLASHDPAVGLRAALAHAGVLPR